MDASEMKKSSERSARPERPAGVLTSGRSGLRLVASVSYQTENCGVFQIPSSARVSTERPLLGLSSTVITPRGEVAVL